MFDIKGRYKILMLDEFQLRAVYASIVALGYKDMMSLDDYIEFNANAFYLFNNEYLNKGSVSYCESLDYFENLTGDNSSEYAEMYWYDLVREAGVLV